MKQLVLRPYLVLAGLLLLGSVVWAGGSQNPATTFIWDQSGDKIRSDGQFAGYYYNGTDCAQSWVDSNGNYFLRTAKAECTPVTQRSVVLDFSDPVTPIDPSNCIVDDAFGQSETLNICAANSLPDVRLVAPKMFTTTALTRGTPVKLLINLQPANNGRGAFELDFEQNLYVAGSQSSRTLSAGSQNEVAELYLITAKKSKVSLGRFRMPFAMTITQ